MMMGEEEEITTKVDNKSLLPPIGWPPTNEGSQSRRRLNAGDKSTLIGGLGRWPGSQRERIRPSIEHLWLPLALPWPNSGGRIMSRQIDNTLPRKEAAARERNGKWT